MAIKIRLEDRSREVVEEAARDLQILGKGRVVFGKSRKAIRGDSVLWRIYGHLVDRKPPTRPTVEDDDLPF